MMRSLCRISVSKRKYKCILMIGLGYKPRKLNIMYNKYNVVCMQTVRKSCCKTPMIFHTKCPIPCCYQITGVPKSDLFS